MRSLLDQRGDEAEDLLAWVRTQPPTPTLIVEAVSRWVDSFTEEKLNGIRFISAKPLLISGLTGRDEQPRVGAGLSLLADELGRLLPRRSPEAIRTRARRRQD